MLSNTGILASSSAWVCPSLASSFSSSPSSLFSSSLSFSLSQFFSSSSIFFLRDFLWCFIASSLDQYLPYVLQTLLSNLFHGTAIQLKWNNVIIESFFRNSFYQQTVGEWCEGCWTGQVLKGEFDWCTAIVCMFIYGRKRYETIRDDCEPIRLKRQAAGWILMEFVNNTKIVDNVLPPTQGQKLLVYINCQQG